MHVYNLCRSCGNVRTHTLLGEEEHGPKHRGVFAVGGKIKCSRRACCRGRLQTMHVTDVEGLAVESLGVALVCSGPSGAPLAVTAPPNCHPRTVLSRTGRGSRKPGRG